MTKRDQMIMRKMRLNANSFEAGRLNRADAPLAVNPAATVLAAAAGNPGFAAQFDLQLLLKFFSIVDATGVATLLTPANLFAAQPNLATQMPQFIFGNSDFAAGFKRTQQAYPLTLWSYGNPFIYGAGAVPSVNGLALDATVLATLQKGDLVIPIYYDSGATTYVSLSIVRCNQVGYGTLLDALNSDRFVMNMVRYVMADTSADGLAQFNQNIGVYKQSLFGKFDSDFISPTSFKMPEQMQNGIIDVPLEKGIDKQVILGTYQNYNAPTVQWSIFVAAVDKLAF